MLFLTKYQSNLVERGFCSLLPQQSGDLIWKFAKMLWWQILFLHFWQGKLLWMELKIYGGVIFTILLHFHYFISLETTNTQKLQVFLLRISSGNVNASVVTCRHPQIYNFSFRKEFSETLCRILTTSSTTPFVKNSRTSCVSSL